ncbi:MAG: endonuclease III domain-containing protein [Candidatus Omnitrophota bacterium]
MAVDNSNMSRVISRMNSALKDMPEPAVTMVGKRWGDPYLVLISCLLSLRTKDETTLPASERLFSLADSPSRMLRLRTARIEKAIYPVGFYRTKACRIRDVSADLIGRFDGKVPDTLEGLLSLKGVGRKTANLVLVEGFDKPGICVDTHVHRISNRLGYVSTETAEQTEQALRKKLPRCYWKKYNALLVMWGQNICRPVSPLCSQCAVSAMCAQTGVGRKR